MKRLPLATFGLLAAFFLSSCATRVIPYGLGPEELIQRGQEASDRNRFRHALQYYQAVLERHPGNSDSVVAAEYEIAFIHYRQRNMYLAREGMNAILERFDAPGGDMLPEKFRVLARMILGRIDEHEARRGGFFRRR